MTALASLEPRDLPVSASLLLALKVCTTKPSHSLCFKNYVLVPEATVMSSF